MFKIDGCWMLFPFFPFFSFCFHALISGRASLEVRNQEGGLLAFTFIKSTAPELGLLQPPLLLDGMFAFLSIPLEPLHYEF